ncbi:MAG: hypothetical protein ACYS18_01015 [Planctomycetota bacterium]|jgi:hypothetical protein
MKISHAKTEIALLAISFCIVSLTKAGPYTETGVNGYIGDDWRHANPFEDADAVINPIFRGWATGVESYEPTPQEIEPQWTFPTNALGVVTADHYWGVVSLGDLNQPQIDDPNLPPGSITLSFAETIFDGNGYDFVVFENGIISNYDTNNSSISGEMFSELGYVEVSSDGNNFARFPTVSLTPQPSGPYGYLTMEISDRYNFAGKHPNANGICTGTPFDLSELTDDPNVVSGLVDINNINYVRIVDIPGSGDFNDSAVQYIDPNTQPAWDYYTVNHPIYDAWVTYGSGGLDLDAIGVLHEQQYAADINLDGMVDMFDFAIFASAWQSRFGEENWIARCDLAPPKNYIVDILDFAQFTTQWLQIEQWRGAE